MSDSSQGEGWWQASDGKWYPPQSEHGAPPPPPGGGPGFSGGNPKADAAAAKAYAKAQRPWYKKKRFMIPLVLVLIIVIAMAAGGGGDDDEGGDTASSDDGATDSDGATTEIEEVTITECGPPDAIGVVYVKGEAANGSSERSDYIIEVAVEGPDGTQIGTGTTFAENVESGQTALWQALTDTDQESWVDGATCTVVDVERNASL